MKKDMLWMTLFFSVVGMVFLVASNYGKSLDKIKNNLKLTCYFEYEAEDSTPMLLKLRDGDKAYVVHDYLDGTQMYYSFEFKDKKWVKTGKQLYENFVVEEKEGNWSDERF